MGASPCSVPFLGYELAVSRPGYVARMLLTLEGYAPAATSRVPLDLTGKQEPEARRGMLLLERAKARARLRSGEQPAGGSCADSGPRCGGT